MSDVSDLQSLLDRLHALTTELADDHRELATVLRSENECRVQTWMSTEGTDGQRSHAARLQALSFSSDVFTIKGNIAALETERTYLLTVIEAMRNAPQ